MVSLSNNNIEVKYFSISLIENSSK